MGVDMDSLFESDAPRCVHDEVHTTEWLRGKTTRSETVCSGCGHLLYTLEGLPGSRTTVYHDELYEALYTRVGRLKLIMALLEARGWPVPAAWLLSGIEAK